MIVDVIGFLTLFIGTGVVVSLIAIWIENGE